MSPESTNLKPKNNEPICRQISRTDARGRVRSAAERVAGVLSGEGGGGRGEEEEGEEGEGEDIGERRGRREEGKGQGGEEKEGNGGGDGRGERSGMREGDVEGG